MMFAIIYQPSDEPVSLITDEEGITISGQWKIDTANDGSIDTYDDLETALSRVNHIRSLGGEACLAAIIE